MSGAGLRCTNVKMPWTGSTPEKDISKAITASRKPTSEPADHRSQGPSPISMRMPFTVNSSITYRIDQTVHPSQPVVRAHSA